MSHIRYSCAADRRTGRLFRWVVGIASTARAAVRRNSASELATEPDRSTATLPVAMGRVWHEVDSHRDLLHLLRMSAQARARIQDQNGDTR